MMGGSGTVGNAKCGMRNAECRVKQEGLGIKNCAVMAKLMVEGALKFSIGRKNFFNWTLIFFQIAGNAIRPFALNF